MFILRRSFDILCVYSYSFSCSLFYVQGKPLAGVQMAKIHKRRLENEVNEVNSQL